MATAKTHTWTPTTKNGFMNTELDNLWDAINNDVAPLVHTHVEADITDLQSYVLPADLADYQAKADFRLFIPASGWIFDPAVTNPATMQYSLGAGRTSAISIPTGSTNLFLWTHLDNASVPWEAGVDRIWVEVWYGLSVSGSASDVVRIGQSAYTYDSGDVLTAAGVGWNENNDIDVSSDVAGSIYKSAKREDSTTWTTDEFSALRLSFVRSNAAYTYTAGNVYFYGAAFYA